MKPLDSRSDGRAYGRADGNLVEGCCCQARPDFWARTVAFMQGASPRPSVSYYNCLVAIHSLRHTMTIDDQDDDTRLYLGPTRDAKLLEVVTIVREDGSEMAVHAMAMRAKYRRLLPGG